MSHLHQALQLNSAKESLQHPRGHILRIPTELLLQISRYISTPSISNLMRSHPRLYQLLFLELHRNPAQSAIVRAIQYDNVAVMQRILSLGFNPNTRLSEHYLSSFIWEDDEEGLEYPTPLAIAVFYTSVATVKLLLEKGADPDIFHVYLDSRQVYAESYKVQHMLLLHGARDPDLREYRELCVRGSRVADALVNRWSCTAGPGGKPCGGPDCFPYLPLYVLEYK